MLTWLLTLLSVVYFWFLHTWSAGFQPSQGGATMDIFNELLIMYALIFLQTNIDNVHIVHSMLM